MDRTHRKQLRVPGMVFLAVGLAFLAVGASTARTAFLAMGPSMVGVGVVFIALSRRRAA